MGEEFKNIQTGEYLDSEKINTLPNNALLRLRPDLWCEWDFQKNDELGYDIWKITKGGIKKMYWLCPKCNSSYDSTPNNRYSNRNCSYCSGRKVNHTNSLASTKSEVAKLWHPNKNGNLTPHDVTWGANRKVWWTCEACKIPHEEYIRTKVSKNGRCPYCKGKKLSDLTSLKYKNPRLAKQWHPTKNGELTPNDVTCGSGKKVWWLGKCGHEWETTVEHRSRGNKCPYCSNQRLLVGFNDMWTTNPELASLLANPEDGYKYMQSSNCYVDWKCPECNSIVNSKNICNVLAKGLSCPICSDGIKYPEKFMYRMLSQLNVYFIKELTRNYFKWTGSKRYDFYIPSLNIIIETHGKQHTYDVGISKLSGGRSLEEEQANDRYKYELAIANGITHENYIVIDCSYSNLEYVRSSILDSRLAEIFDLSDIEWFSIEKMCSKSILVEVCEHWNNQTVKSTTEISEIFKISRSTVIKYLKKGTFIGLCQYDKDATRINNIKAMYKPIVQLSLDNQFIKEWESTTTVCGNLNLNRNNIYGALDRKSHISNGFKWMRLEDYNKYLEEQGKLE